MPNDNPAAPAPMRVREHELKVDPQFWEPLLTGEKCFEVRRDDRGFQRGDILVLQKTKGQTVIRDLHGKVMYEIRRRVLWVLMGGQYGIESGYVVMGLGEIEQ